MPSEVFNNEAEQLLLAAILRNPESYFDINSVGLDTSDFANREHRWVFEAILFTVDNKKDPTVPFVIESLRKNKHSSAIDYVGELTSVPCTVEQAKDYAKVVKGLAVSRSLGNAGARIIDIASEKRADYNSAIVEAERVVKDLSLNLPEQERSPLALDILERMNDAKVEDKIPVHFSTTLQSMTGGISKGHFWVVGAFSSTGKSAFVSNFVIDALVARKRVAVISAEMTQEQYMVRMLSIKSGVPMADISSRVTIGLEKQTNLVNARRWIGQQKLYIYDNLYRLPQIRTELHRLKNLKGLDLIVLDYIQNVSVTGDEVSDAREVALECQRLAKDLDVAVIACSQLSNEQARYEIQGGDDNFYSLKGHGSIRDAADVILTLHRDRARQSNALKVKFRKNRHGPISDFMCNFNLATSGIQEIAWEDEELDT